MRRTGRRPNPRREWQAVLDATAKGFHMRELLSLFTERFRSDTDDPQEDARACLFALAVAVAGMIYGGQEHERTALRAFFDFGDRIKRMERDTGFADAMDRIWPGWQHV